MAWPDGSTWRLTLWQASPGSLTWWQWQGSPSSKRNTSEHRGAEKKVREQEGKAETFFQEHIKGENMENTTKLENALKTAEQTTWGTGVPGQENHTEKVAEL